MGDPDLIYYDFSLFNDSTKNTVAQLQNRRQAAVLSNPSEYEGSIIRFTVDANWPLFIPAIPNPVGAPLVTNMSISFSYLGNFFQQFVSITAQEAKNGVFDFGIFLNDINAASVLAFTAMKAAFPGAPGAYAPYFALDSKTSLISIYVDDGWLDDVGAPNFIWFNSYLQDILGFPANIRSPPPQPSGADYQIAVKQYSPILPPTPNRYGFPYALNGLAGNIIQVSQEYVQLAEFSDIATIMFTTNQIPIAAEYLPISTGLDQSVSTQDNFLPIITDFSVVRSDAKPRDNSFVYLPTAEYRMFSLMSNQPLTGLDIKAYYTTFDGKLYELLLPPGGSMTLKLLFRKKNKNRI
jgi:hypothetical protein